MKICTLQVVIAMTLSSLALAHNNYGQVLDQKITLSLNEVSIEKALREIEAVANVQFFYSLDQLHISNTLSLEAHAEPLGLVLDKLLRPYDITYRVHEKNATITLKRSHKRDPVTPLKPSEEAPSGRASPAHDGTLTGKVTDVATGLPMAGVSIIIKGTMEGTTTDAQGNFSLYVHDNDILVFSFIGYTSFETSVNGKTHISVEMREDTKSLKEVVVNAGYWTVRDREQTGNIARVTAEEIERQPVTNPITALQGKIPGVYIQEQNGIPGGPMKIEIRGRNSLRNSYADNGNLPFFVVDGVPFSPQSQSSDYLSMQNGNPFISINPADIESIEVLKDADATAIYGSRGANGVVLITTKKGKAGKTRVSIDLSMGAGDVAHKLDLLSTPEYIEMRREGFRNDGRTPGSRDYDVNGTWDTLRYTDWQDVLIGGTAKQTNATLSFSGGSAQTQFMVSGSFFKQGYVFPGDAAFKRGSGRVDLNHRSTDEKLELNISSAFSATNNNLSADYTLTALTLAPNAPALYDSAGNLNWEDNTWSNPLAMLEKEYSNNTNHLIANGAIAYRPFSGVTIRSTMGYTNTATNEISTKPISQYAPDYQTGYGLTGSATFGGGSIQTWIVEPQLEYQKSIRNGNLRLFLGSTFQRSERESQTINADGYTSDALLKNINAAAEVTIRDARYSQYRYNAIFGRINYTWKDKYFVNLTGRRDGSSRFGPGRQFANFGAAGIAWLFSEEPFLKNSALISFGKLRTSYGTTGNDRIRDYQYLNTYTSTQFPYNGTTGLVLTRLSNPDYSWETVKKFEVGLEVGFFKDRISLSMSRYQNRATDQLVGRPLPLITGQSSIQYNLPAVVENSGWEFSLRSQNIASDRFQWATNLNLTFPRNELIAFPDLDQFPAYVNDLSVGKSIYSHKVYRYTGVDPETGLYTFQDYNGDNRISSPEDAQAIEEISQPLFGSLYNSLQYKQFELSVLVQFVQQNARAYHTSFQRPGRMSNQLNEVETRWRESGDITNIQRYSAAFSPAQSAHTYYTQSTAGVVDASFVRLRNVSLSWLLPKTIVEKLHLTRSRISIQGQNLITLTNYLGLSPENQNAQTLPPLRIITAGLQLTF